MEHTTAQKVAPAKIQEKLSKDVHAILSVCIQHFDEVTGVSKDECFDVDAVIEGRTLATDGDYRRRVTPAAYARPTQTSVPSILSVPQKGYFIPTYYASHMSIA